MKNWRDFAMASLVLLVCVGMPQVLGVSGDAFPHLIALLGSFALIWRLCETHLKATDVDEIHERLDLLEETCRSSAPAPAPAPAPESTDSK